MTRRTSVAAPELDSAVAWLNVDRAPSLRELRGCVVVLDFWTYCRIDCMHVVPVLREIERRHARDPVVVIGVHSGKLVTERPDGVQAVLGRFGGEHPVAIDEHMTIWSRYGIVSWPTIVVVRPDGNIAAMAPGAPDIEILDGFICTELERGRRDGTLAAHPPRVARSSPRRHEPLLYPGKVALTPGGGILIADSGHHRILLCAHDGQVDFVAGSGVRGLLDGPAERAAFDDPQGLCMHDGAVYVADTRNHAIRRIDVQSRCVSTVAGTGVLGTPRLGRFPARETALRSPWDLCSVGDVIYVAMAGSHGIWKFMPKSEVIEHYAGTGAEALVDGSVANSAWSQPSALVEKNGTLYVADSESSAIRAIDLETDVVTTLVGHGLGMVGDDGSPEEATLQHCMGVAVDGEDLVIADTYNGKIKRLSYVGGERRIRTVIDGLNEPGSVVVANDGVLLIADTNAHRVLGVREGAIAELNIVGAPTPERGAIDVPRRSERPKASADGWFTTMLELPEGLGLKPGDAGISLILRTPPGTSLAPESPMRIHVEVSRYSDLLRVSRPSFGVVARGGGTQMVAIELRIRPSYQPVVEAEVIATIDYVACRQDDVAIRVPDRVHVRIPVRVLSEGGERQLEFGVYLASMDAHMETSGEEGRQEDGRE